MMGTLFCFFMYLPHDKYWKTPMLKMKTLNPIPNFNSSLSLKCHSSTTSPHLNQFTVSYLITNFGFSLETATRLSKSVRFTTSERPDAVIAIFTNLGFSGSQINHIVSVAPNILACKYPHKRILSKFEFLLSKGASYSDIVEIVYRSPVFLNASLDNCIIPTFELVRRFFQSDDEVIQYLLKCFFGHRLMKNVKLLLDHGVNDSNIRHLLLNRPSMLSRYDISKALDAVKEMGFNDPFNVNFFKTLLALLAKRSLSKSKVLAYKKWGWSDEMILEALRKQPESMLSSEEKINKVMRFWVNELGWNSLALVKRAEIFKFSLENRIIPRACVVSYLISKGLIKKNDELSTPFAVTEKKFLEMYVHRYKEERHNLLKLYQEKLDGQKIKENGEASL